MRDLSDITIAKFGEEAWEAYKNIRLEALLTEPQAFGASYEKERNLSETEWRSRLTNPDRNTYIAWKGSKPIALAVTQTEKADRISHVAGLYSFFVSALERKRGIGTSILEFLLKDLRDDPTVKKVKLSVNPEQRSAVLLYEKNGFKRSGISEKEMHLNGRYYDQMQMELLFEGKIRAIKKGS